MTTKGAHTALTVLALLTAAPSGLPQAGAPPEVRDTDMSADRGGHLGNQSTLGDILRHPAFTGFGHLIMPWDDRAYDEGRLDVTEQAAEEGHK
jgi:hypothetical protein